MTVDESLAMFKAQHGFSPAEREQAYTVTREEILHEIAAAPTPALKARYQRKLSDLEAAYTVTKGVSVANLPKTVSGSPSSSPEPSADTSKVLTVTLPPPPVEMPTEAGHIVDANPREGLIKVGIGALVLLFICGLALFIASKYAKEQTLETPAANTLAVADTGTIASVASQPKTLIVTTERQDYQNGEDVVCLVDIPFDGHLRVYSIDVKGVKTQIFPNGFEPNGTVRAGSRIRIPGTPEYTLKLGLPSDSKGGDESVVAVLSPTPFEDGSVPNANTPFPSVEASTNLKTRGLSAQAVGNTANGVGSYRVSP